ncbi:MAG: potassium transporter TrkA, partial [Chloroflexi bacterium]|nr:potassium transporter TrkA [Chloroflexota bacterium]
MSHTWKEKLRYQFDNFMAKGTVALIGGLAVLSVLLIVIMAAVVSLLKIAPGNGEPVGFLEAAWLSLMRTLDAGTMGGDEGWSFRIVMFMVTLGGVFVISTLIGALTSGIESRMEELRKGRSRVIEAGHTVILGWSSQIYTILSELITANENHPGSCIVILGDRDKVEMEEQIQTAVGKNGKTRLVCRSGTPIDPNDLELASLQTARSIIVLAPESDDPDAATIKTILAITNNPRRRSAPYHIVAEIPDPKNLEVARLVGRDEVELVLTSSLISRIIAQTCRQSGLSVVYTELLDFGGDEIYFKEEAELAGKTFGEALHAYKDSAVIGLHSPGQGVRLNPSMDTLLRPGDQVIAISEDDDTIRLSHRAGPGFEEGKMTSRQSRPHHPERTLILGWNWRVPMIINELDQYTAPGSSITLVADYENGEAELARLCTDIQNETISFHKDDTTDRRTLDALKPESYDQVIVLSYSDTLDVQEADARTLITLLHLRDIADRGGYDFAIVSEMLDLRNRTLAEVTQVDDFIVSDRMISLILSQISENKALNAVFTDIFDPEGSAIYLKPAGDYVLLGEPVNFYTVLESARRRGEVAFGYHLKAYAGDASRSYGVVLNPDKSD